jgi:hypothetical protein
MNRPIFVAVQALLAVGSLAVAVGIAGCSGGGAEGGCAATPSCAGDPTGFWQVASKCQFLPTQPAQPLNYTDYMGRPPNPVVSPLQSLPTTNGDWCSNLDYPAGGIEEVILWHPAALLTGGSLWLKQDKTYVENLVFSTPATSHFTLACLQAEGASSTCKQFESDLIAFFMMPQAQAQGISGIQCEEASDRGCDCSYKFEVDLADQGTWAADGQGLMSMNSSPPSYTFNGTFIPEYEPPVPVTASYCKSGALTLTGVGGSSLAGILGLRTLTMTSAPPPAAPAGDGGM